MDLKRSHDRSHDRSLSIDPTTVPEIVPHVGGPSQPAPFWPQVPIHVSQIESHPYLPQRQLLEYANKHQVRALPYASRSQQRGDGSRMLIRMLIWMPIRMPISMLMGREAVPPMLTPGCSPPDAHWTSTLAHPHLHVFTCVSPQVVLTAYSPLGSPDNVRARKESDPLLLGHPRIAAIGRSYSKSAAQVLVRFHSQRGVVAIPKSKTPAYIAANLDTFDFELSDAHMEELLAMESGFRFGPNDRDKVHPLFPW